MRNAGILLALIPVLRAGAEAAMALFGNPQLLFDDAILARTENLKQRIEAPVKHPANPLIVQEHPWESRYMQVYGTVLYDADRGKFRMWYLGSADPDMIPEYYMCYAESEDGVKWERPFIGATDLTQYGPNNIVVPGGHGMCILADREEPNPERRFKGLGGDTLAFSPDGVHWSMKPFPSAGKNDTSSCVVRWGSEYLAYVRNQANAPEWQGVMRALALCRSTDYEQWTPKETILITDAEDGYPWTQVYGMAVTPYGDALIGLPWFIHLDNVPGNNTLGDMDIQLAVSRDGRTWRRAADRAPLLSPTAGTWDRGGVFPSTTLVTKDDTVRIYYTGRDKRHGETGARLGIGLATLPADRFVALESVDKTKPGSLETVTMDPAGSGLLVNAEADPDDLAVEVLDPEGHVQPGLDAAHCMLARRDSLRFSVKWRREDGSVQSLPDGSFRLRFLVKQGSLYAFQVVE